VSDSSSGTALEPIDCPECNTQLPEPDEWDGLLTHCSECNCPLWLAAAAGFVQWLKGGQSASQSEISTRSVGVDRL